MDCYLLSTRFCECSLSYVSSSRVLSSHFSSTSLLSDSYLKTSKIAFPAEGSSVPRKTLISYHEVLDGFKSNVKRVNGTHLLSLSRVFFILSGYVHLRSCWSLILCVECKGSLVKDVLVGMGVGVM